MVAPKNDVTSGHYRPNWTGNGSGDIENKVVELSSERREVQLPGTMLIRVGQRGARGSRGYSQTLELDFRGR